MSRGERKNLLAHDFVKRYITLSGFHEHEEINLVMVAVGAALTAAQGDRKGRPYNDPITYLTIIKPCQG